MHLTHHCDVINYLMLRIYYMFSHILLWDKERECDVLFEWNLHQLINIKLCLKDILTRSGTGPIFLA